MSVVLHTEGLSVRYGAVQALDAVDLEVERGQLVGLIGPNGAGKTTLVDALSGFARSTGRIELAGRDIGRLSPHLRARQGLARTWQSGMLFDDLTVAENLSIAAAGSSWWRAVGDALRGRSGQFDAGQRVLEDLDLGGLGDADPASLTQGQRKLVGVARAIAANPTLVCLDEPAAGLDTEESRALGKRLRAIVDRGLTALLIDHDMGLVLSVCDRVVVLDYGRVIFAGAPAAVRSDPEVIRAYLGTGGDAPSPPGELASSPSQATAAIGDRGHE